MYRQVTRMRMAMISAAALGVLGATWVSDPGAAAQARQPAPVASVGAARPPASPGGTLRAAVRRALGGPTAPAASAIQRTRLTASDAHRGSNFGNSVAISGDTAVVGAWGWPGNAVGAAYVFVRSGTGWSQQAKLTAADAAGWDEFGWSVAISGNTAVIGAYAKNSTTGAAYVFVRSGTTWSQQAKLTATDGAGGDQFGWSAAISGDTAVIGAREKNSEAGAAYVFVRSGTTWSQQAKLTAPDAPADLFGSSVAISPAGSTAVIGAAGHTDNNGEAYVFVRSGTTWSQQAKLTAADGGPGDAFGDAVSISKGTALVGAFGKDYQTGAAYVFVHSGATWSQQAKLTAADAARGAAFGWSVATTGSTALIGAGFDNSKPGAAYVFTRSQTAWSQRVKLVEPGAGFGSSVAISGPTAVVGVPYPGGSTGAAWVFAGV